MKMNHKVIGTIGLLGIGNNEVALRKMFVNKDDRGSELQVAKSLLNHAIEFAQSKFVSTIYLGTTPQFLVVHRFYKKNGFVDIDYKELPNSFPIVKVDRVFYRLEL